MLDVFHKRFYRRAAVSVMPCNDVVDWVYSRLSSLWVHVLNLLSQSLKCFPVMKKARTPAPVNQSGIKSEI